jgi:hypothetical protein
MGFAGAPDALYERRIKFDNLVDPESANSRERYKAAARAVRDILSDRWLQTDNYYTTGPTVENEMNIWAPDASVAVRAAVEASWPAEAIGLRTVDREGCTVFERLQFSNG